MATLILKKPTAGDLFINDLGIIIPGSGQEEFQDAATLVQVATSLNIRTFVIAGTLIVNDGANDLSVAAGLSYLTTIWAFAGFDNVPSGFMRYPFMPGRARRFWSIQQNSGLTSVNNSGFLTAPTVNGTASVVHASDGQWLNYATAAIADREGGWISSAFNQVQRQNAPIFGVVFKTGSAVADIQNARIWIGLFSATPIAAAMPAIHLAGFRYDTTVDGTAFWRCVTNDGGAGTITTTSVAVAQDTKYELLIDMSDQSNVRFYINGVLVATHTTTLPGSTQNIGHHEQIRTLVASAKNVKLSRIFMEHN
jgi:hypothetical protein